MLTTPLADPASWSYHQSPYPALHPPAQVVASTAALDDWTPCTQFPSQIHVELLAKELIPDPRRGMNEQAVQWVGEEDWVYRTTFESTGDEGCADMVFEGLDTFAVVFLNDEEILDTENMFRTYRVGVSDKLRPAGETNSLVIVFQSAFIKGRMIEEKYVGKGEHNEVWNGDASRVWVRKAGYNYGWDWGPVLMTAGPWRPIRLESYSARVTDFHPTTTVNADLEAKIALSVSFAAIPPSHEGAYLGVNFSLADPTGSIVREFVYDLSTDDLDSSPPDTEEKLTPGKVDKWITGAVFTKFEFEAGGVELWWSVGLGGQPLYTAKAELLDSAGEVVHTVSKRVGFRRLRVVQEPLIDAPGTSFYFEVNNVPIFCGGSNWIPMDSFLTSVTKERYRRWLTLLVEGGQNMIRSWGGGVYEDDAFFDLCDELGILVWQDFAFACGQYPAHSEFVANVKAEAEDNVERLRHHVCLALFAGNNEDYQIAESAGLEYDPEDQDGDWTKTTFPAREIYERTLPEVVERLSDVFYHPGSPWGGKDTRDPTVGDIHQWNVWHGSQEPYQNFDKLSGRFVSEFGMQGYPDIRTIDFFLDGKTSERHPQSKTIGYHNKATGHERRLELYLIENIRHGFDLESYLYAAQLIQAETLSTAYRLWRREFKGPGKAYTAGALVWQLNDVYPCTSWAIVDYFLRPKPAYYAIKQALAPLAVGTKRYTTRTYPSPISLATFVDTNYVEAWASSSLLASKEVVVVTEAFARLTGNRVWGAEKPFVVEPNQSTELIKFKVPEGDAVVICARLRDVETKEILSRSSAWPEPYKFLTFPEEELVALVVWVGEGEIRVRAETPVKGLIFTFSDDVWLEDNCLDLIPGEERVFKVKGLKEETKVQWRYLGDRFSP